VDNFRKPSERWSKSVPERWLPDYHIEEPNMTDEFATLNKSRDLFASREESDISPGISPLLAPEHQPGTNADAPAAFWETSKNRHPSALPPRIGKYLVIAPLGGEHQAQVFRVLDTEMGREFILKLYPDRASNNPTAYEQLRREGRLVVACRHPNLLGIVDVDLHEGHPFVVTERVQGMSLTDYIRERRPDAREVAGLVVELARAVDYIHAQGIVHQNLTHASVLIDETGRPRLIDFASERLKATWSDKQEGLLERSRSEPRRRNVTGHDATVGLATDVFGLATILKHVLMGQLAESRSFEAPRLEPNNETAARSSGTIHPRVPRALQRICEKGTAPDPSRRYQTAAELGWALRRYQSRRWFAWTVSVILAGLAAAFFAGS
jgi:eukaryotic-like serine/threonine-protein kinase